MRWLTAGGAAAALAVGAATVWGTNWRGFALLLAFFVSGSLLTRGGRQRTAQQVVANGGVAALAALAGTWPAFAGALAAATADTWATEIGAAAARPPRMITTGTPVPRGTSGGITALGTVGGVLGAGFIAALASWLDPHPQAGGPGSTAVAAAVAAAGIVGMLVDSLLGATLQGSEQGVRLDRGYAWLDNDAVNLAATFAGAAVGGVWAALR